MIIQHLLFAVFMKVANSSWLNGMPSFAPAVRPAGALENRRSGGSRKSKIAGCGRLKLKRAVTSYPRSCANRRLTLRRLLPARHVLCHKTCGTIGACCFQGYSNRTTSFGVENFTKPVRKNTVETFT